MKFSREKLSLKQALNCLGHFIAILSVLFIGYKLQGLFSTAIKETFDYKIIVLMLLLSFLYTLDLIFLAYLWRKLLILNRAKITLNAAIAIFGQSQIAKYIPGNFFHLLSRQLLGRKVGISQQLLIKVSLSEIWLLVISAASLASMMLSYQYLGYVGLISVLLFYILIAIYFYYFARLNQTHKQLFLYCGFHFFSALLFLVILKYISPNGVISLSIVFLSLGAFVLAWLVGFVTPGAPGGVGVREVVLFTILGAHFQEATLIISLILSRMVTLLGDLWFYFLAYIVQKRQMSRDKKF